MNIVIVRHGESVNNTPDRSAHTLDPDLTPRGMLQVELVGERFADVKLDAIISSPLRRTLRTANAISVRHGNMPVLILHDMVETGTDYPALSYEKMLELCPNALPITNPSPAGGNLILDGDDPYYNLERAYRIISFVRNAYPDDATVLLSAHGSFNQRLIAAALRTAYPPDFLFSQENTGVSVINYRPDENSGHMITRLVTSNDTSHLYHAAKLGRYTFAGERGPGHEL